MRTILLIIMALIATTVDANYISESEALSFAKKAIGSKQAESPLSTSQLRKISKKFTSVENNRSSSAESPYYVFNIGENEGFIIIGGNDLSPKILGYSDNGSFTFDNMPPQLSWLMESYERGSRKLSNLNQSKTIANNSINLLEEAGILLETANWGQQFPYNLACPVFDNVHSPTGCVATAMAIVMKYHNWPDRGRYSWEIKNDNIYKDFSKSEYRFESFADHYGNDTPITSDIENLSHLMSDLGIACNMYYGKEESKSATSHLGYLLSRFFKYSPESRHLIRRDFSDEEWRDYIIRDLNNKLPIIYSASSDLIGSHTFVIDGYKGNLYHINWGWDGRLNGYFDIESLNPYNVDEGSYDKSHSMIIGIEPDKDSQEFSEIWLDSGTERGYDWQPLWLQDSFIGKGMCIDCTDVVSGRPFSLITETITAPTSFDGQVGIAITGSDDSIIEIIKTVDVNSNADHPTLGSIPYYYLYDAHIWKDLVFHGQIEPGMRIQLIAKRNSEQDWKRVNGTPETPTCLPVTGNTPNVLRENVTIHGTEELEADVVDYDYQLARIGQNNSFSLYSKFGVAHIYRDDMYLGTQDDFNFKFSDLYNPNGFGNPLTSSTRKTDIYYTPQNQLVSKIIDDVVPGTLEDRFDEDDIRDVYKLKISGSLNNQDLLVLNKLRSLGELDLFEASLEGNILSTPLPKLRVLNLPRNLKSADVPYDYYGDHMVKILNVPESLEDLGGLEVRDFIVFNSPVPPTANPETIKRLTLNYQKKAETILIVPQGCKKMYQEHEYWSHFAEIIEMESDDYFDAYFKVYNDIMYCQITNKLIALTNVIRFRNENTMNLPDDSFRFPYHVAELPLNINGKKITFYKEMKSYTTEEKNFNGREFFFIPSDGFLSTYGYVGWDNKWTCPLQYIITPGLFPNFSGVSGYAIVPAHNKIDTNGMDEDTFGNRIWKKYEMFGMVCDKTKNLIKISPELEGVEIDQVNYDGVTITPTHPFIYPVDFTRHKNISVSYSFNNIKMETEYPESIIESLPDVSLEEMTSARDIEINESEIVKIFDLSGRVIYVGNRIEEPCLENGIYIVAKGQSVKKVIVNK